MFGLLSLTDFFIGIYRKKNCHSNEFKIKIIFFFRFNNIDIG